MTAWRISPAGDPSFRMPFPALRSRRQRARTMGPVGGWPPTASRWPASTDGLAAIPANGSHPNGIENPLTGLGEMRDLDDRSGMAFIPKIDEAAAGAVALLADRIA